MAYNSTDKMLFEVQWCPEKFFSQFFNGADNSPQMVIVTTKILVIMAAQAEEKINRIIKFN